MFRNLKWKKTTWIYIVALVLVLASTLFLTGAFGEINEDFTAAPLFTDTNVISIDINQEYKQGDIIFKLKSLEVGDNYSVLLFDSPIGVEMITGADLFQNGVKLKYISAGTATNKYVDSAIAFEAAKGLENIELYINEIKVSVNTKVYPLEYTDNIAKIETVEDGVTGYIEVVLSEKECSLTISNDLQDIIKSSVDGYPIVPGNVILLKDGIAIHESNYEYSIQDPPDEVRVTEKEVIIIGKPVVIKIS